MAEYNFKVNQGADLTVPFLLIDASGGGHRPHRLHGGNASQKPSLFNRSD